MTLVYCYLHEHLSNINSYVTISMLSFSRKLVPGQKPILLLR